MEVGRGVGCLKLDGFSLILLQHISACLAKSRGLAMVGEALDHVINVILIFKEWE